MKSWEQLVSSDMPWEMVTGEEGEGGVSAWQGLLAQHLEARQVGVDLKEVKTCDLLMLPGCDQDLL